MGEVCAQNRNKPIMADDTVYEITLNIIPVRIRPCKPYQEKISDFAPDGRPRFEWETMRHKKMLYGDMAVDATCADCSINIMQCGEGCKSLIYGLEVFLKAVACLVPDSLCASINLEAENSFDAARTVELADDLAKIEQVFNSSNWKVAQLYAYDEPVMEYFGDGSSRPRFYPWNAEILPCMISGNEGYQIYLCTDGIIVKSNFDEGGSHIYEKLVRDDSGVRGVTKEGENVPFQALMDRYPEWDKEDPRSDGELRFVELNAGEVFRDTLDMLMVFTTVARNSKTGFTLNVV